jgi:hypothetical protein
LHRTWRRQALPIRGLLQVSRSSSWQRVLQAMSTARAARRCLGERIATARRRAGIPLTSTEHVRSSRGAAGHLLPARPRSACRARSLLRYVVFPPVPGTLCFGAVQSCRERSCAPTELYGTGGARGKQYGVSQALLQTERGRGRRHLILISTSGSGTGSGLSGTTEGFHQLWTLHLLSLSSLSPTQPSKKRKAADLCGVTDHADQGWRAGEEEENCDDITYDDVEAYVPRGLIQLLSWLAVSSALAALDDVPCTASVRSLDV